ncbi:MAG: sulfite exporter TauE/SafE family protein [Sphingobacteriaceae bacterium]|nr:sulfite exporter TauE/SafE family protein [Cytophagaceae bacterium]
MFYSLAFLTGLLGSLHCLGMCGPLALALPVGGLSPRRVALARGVYTLGRLGTYAVLGVGVGWLGERVFRSGLHQSVSLVAAALVLLAQVPGRWLPFRPAQIFPTTLRQRLMPLLRRRSLAGMLGLGVVNGLLPCGLLYVGLANAAATATSLQGAACMALFGLGTLPAFGIVWAMPNVLNASLRQGTKRLLPVVPFLIAALLLLRGLNLGIPYLSPAFPTVSTTQKRSIPLCHGTPVQP